MQSTMCTRVWYDWIEIVLWYFIHVITEVWGRASSRFYLDQLKIVDSGALYEMPKFLMRLSKCGWWYKILSLIYMCIGKTVNRNFGVYPKRLSGLRFAKILRPTWHILFQLFFCFYFRSLSPVKRRDMGLSLSVRLSVPLDYRVLCPREFGMKELS